MALSSDRQSHAWSDDQGDCGGLALGNGDLGLQGRRSGRGESLGSWPWFSSIRHPGHLAHLFSRFSRNDPAGDEFCLRDAAWQAAAVGRQVEEMMVVTEKGPEVTTQFPIEEI